MRQDGRAPTRGKSAGMPWSCQVVLVVAILLFGGLMAIPALAKPCSARKVAEVLAPATPEHPWARLACDLTLSSQDRVTKRLLLEGAAASHLEIDCRQALLDGGKGTVNFQRDMIEIRSRRAGPVSDPSWERPEHIRIKNCRVRGSIRIRGMTRADGVLRDSSRRPGHVARVRAAAPRDIDLRGLRIEAVGRVALYAAPGVGRVTLAHSVLTGTSRSVGIYLDAESYGHVIRRNHLAVRNHRPYLGGLVARRREEIAVDGASGNRIEENVFARLEGGGIYLYRNCGENGVLRHTPPVSNSITNNRFYFTGAQSKPAIYLGSRHNSLRDGRVYCWLDRGYPWGSSRSNRSYARDNVVEGNRFHGGAIRSPIRLGDASNAPNDVRNNRSACSGRRPPTLPKRQRS